MPRTVVYDTPIVQAELQKAEATTGARKTTGPTAASRRAATTAAEQTPTAAVEKAAVDKPTKDDYPAKLAKYVPGEVVAVSLAGFAAFGPTGNWVWLGLAIAILANLIYLGQQAAKLAVASRPRPYFYILSCVAFVFWAAATIPQVRDSVTAMVNRDAATADSVLEEEDKVDAFRDQVFRILLTHMMGDPRTIGQGLSLILIARNLERIGDHATNIAEEVIYWLKGRDVRHMGGRRTAKAAVAAETQAAQGSSNADSNGSGKAV